MRSATEFSIRRKFYGLYLVRSAKNISDKGTPLCAENRSIKQACERLQTETKVRRFQQKNKTRIEENDLVYQEYI